MKIELAYGRSMRCLEIPDHNLQAVINTGDRPIATGNGNLVNQALRHPKNSPTLTELVKMKRARNTVIVVNDITRPTPYQEILPPLLQELLEAGLNKDSITLLIATGIHRPQTEDENQLVFGSEICSQYRIINHNCDQDLQSVGTLSNGMEMYINREAAQADLLITTGLVGLHYFAGYSGGRKSILPGIVSRQLIEANHKMMDDSRACLGNYRNNPVSNLMIEGARLAGVDFIVNVVTGRHHQIIYAAAGDMFDAWMDAVVFAENISVVPIASRADIVIASCGGYPKDLNVYQAQKALDAAALAVKDRGTILLLAECSEGLGEHTFQEWVMEAACPQDIETRFHTHFELGGHKAYAICRTIRQADIMLYSSLPHELVQRVFMQPVKNLATIINELLLKHGSDASILVMPEAPRIAVNISG